MSNGFKFGRDVIKKNNNKMIAFPGNMHSVSSFLLIMNFAVLNNEPSFRSYDLKIAKLP